MQSLCSLRHFDFNSARAFSYEQAIETIQRLNLDRSAQKEMVRRAILNVTIRNQDDHTKNIAFLMNKMGVWSLAPAFDVVYAYNPQGDWTNEHQMSLNGKTDNFSMDDLFAFGAFTDLKKHEVRRIVDEINESTEQWPRFCEIAGVPKDMAMTAAAGFRKFK
jgi:serine/threonine-protein kinase HipA